MTNSTQSDHSGTAQVIDSLIEDTANRLFTDYCTFEAISASERGEWQSSLWRAIQEAGLSTIDTPENLNGAGAATIDALNVLRLAGYHGAPVPIADHYIASKVYQSLQREIPTDPITIVPPLQTKKLNVTQLKTHWQVDGTLHNVPWARYAQTILLPINTENTCSVLFLERSDLTLHEKNNIAGEPSDSISFNAFQISTDNISACPLTIDQIEQLGALTRSALSWGALEKVMELAVNYAKERTQFGRPIGKFQAVQQDLGKLAGEVASTAVAVEHGIRRFCETADYSTYVAAAKIRASEATGFATTVSHQIHGAMGFTNEYPLHHFSRRLWAWRDEYGSETYWSYFLGKSLVDAPQPSLWKWATAQ